ncbi:ribbon-helix-helix domain-containing protein [Ferroplasma sp.]|uniref:ribbon-helix-helix domain-containing protein n=1 Tax=Ferroplasma sp. TaxID=2591003 RepID=UPI00307CFBA4
MSVPYRITIRVSEDLLDQLQEIVDRNQYNSISEAIRAAINEFIIKNHNNVTSNVDLKLPRNIYTELEEEVNNGNAISVNDLIRFILKEYAKGKTKN